MVGPIEKIPIQANLYSHTGSSIKISGWSGVRFSVRFPVFVLLMVISKKILCRKISFDILVHLDINFSRWSGVRFSIRFPVFVLLMVIFEKFQCKSICIDIPIHPFKFPVDPGSGFLSGIRFLYFRWSHLNN